LPSSGACITPWKRLLEYQIGYVTQTNLIAVYPLRIVDGVRLDNAQDLRPLRHLTTQIALSLASIFGAFPKERWL